MTRRRKYSANHLLYLEIAYQLMTVADLTRAFNAKFRLKKSEVQIKSALKNHGIKCGREPKDRLINRFRMFTPEQVQFLRDNYAGRSVTELAVMFNGRFGTDMTVQQIKTAVHNRHITSGRTGRFPQGHTSWNSGTKGQGLTGANKTSFKKGDVPPNRRPLWSERIDNKDGYIHIKIPEQDPHTGFPTRYVLKHVYLWEQAHGPVPPGMLVAFRDGKKLHCEPGNLMLITRAELLRLNKHGYKNAPAEIKPSILAMAKLEVKTFSMIKGAQDPVDRGRRPG